jgi:putative transposase
MARHARIKAIESGAVFYHLYCRAAGREGEYPLQTREARHKLISLLKFYQTVYQMRVAGFCMMGNHYHLVAEFTEYREMSRAELYPLALKLYKKEKQKLDAWTAEKWAQFNHRIFDVSEFMRNFQAAFARWHNGIHDRKGRFWGDRFKSTLLEDHKAMIDCLLYVELNPVRAAMVERPEAYEGSSLYFREVADDRWMISLEELMPAKTRQDAFTDYRAAVYYRGNVRSKEGQREISNYIIALEESRGFEAPGAYRKRFRHFVDGLVLGSKDFVDTYLQDLRTRGVYLRRRNVLPTGSDDMAMLREQRGTA